MEQSYVAVEHLVCQHGGGTLRILQDSICPHSNDCQFLHRKRPVQFICLFIRPSCFSQLEAISSKVIQLVIRDRPPDPSRMLLVCIWQRFSELACVRVELFEEGDVHPGIPAMEDVREIPAVCAKTNQLPPRLRLTLGDCDDRFLSALAMLTAYLLAEALLLHIALPGDRLLLLAPASWFHHHSQRVRLEFRLLGDNCQGFPLERLLYLGVHDPDRSWRTMPNFAAR